MAYPNPLNPQRVNPNDDGYREIYVKWHESGKGRTFEALNIIWMQITDNEGVCFVPQRPSGGMDFYGQSSYGRINH